MYQLKFTLKQHTPIIHFQHHQDGATLRATEVKPKLDRFIMEKMGGKDSVPEGWFISDKHNALDYKISIVSNGTQKLYLPLARNLNPTKTNNLKTKIKETIIPDIEFLMQTNYFGNEDKYKFIQQQDTLDVDNTYIEQLIFGIKNDKIAVTINTHNSSLKTTLETNLNEFFLSTNFGTRQNKGFGSFTISENIIGKTDLTNTSHLLKSNYLKKNTTNGINAQLTKIYNTYLQLKTGVNQPYSKSDLFDHFIKLDIRWEKRKIKQALNSNGVSLKQRNAAHYQPIDYNNTTSTFYNSYIDNQTNTYNYIRALLGLAEHFEFATNNRGRIKVKVTHLPQPNSEKIERFQSPIIFKIIDNIIYIGVNQSYKFLEGENFSFDYGGGTLCTLPVPTNFDIINFINTNLTTWNNL
ncbi:MAG TPA: hypothetical protein PLK15_01585 [Chitinophagales bacterium]|jgi:CRISPR/Cas system CMR-associated protein Cmr1 (group 7 of RAMP superfamily)|nr:hypothetical protein [Chitinophagales bacterium]